MTKKSSQHESNRTGNVKLPKKLPPIAPPPKKKTPKGNQTTNSA